MSKYSKEELKGFSERDLYELLDEGDVITGIYVQDFMIFSSYTGIPYDTIAETKLVFGGKLAKYRGEGSGPFDVVIKRKVHDNLILGFVTS